MKSSVEKRNITPQQAVEILKKSGAEINEKEAIIILDFLYFFAKLSVDQYIKSQKKPVER